MPVIKPVMLLIIAATQAMFLMLGVTAHADINLVPDKPATAPNYFCTWSAQNYMYGQGLPSMDPAILEGGSGSNLAWQSLTEGVVFGPKGWAYTFYPEVRKDLFFLLDDGYYNTDSAAMDLNLKKFPSFTGTTEQRFKAVSLKLEAAGWRGLALWTRHTPNTAEKIEPLLQRSQSAGVKYWKIDGGDWDFSVQALKQKEYPSLILEHVSGEGPLNGDWTKDGRLGHRTGEPIASTYSNRQMCSEPTMSARIYRYRPRWTASLRCSTGRKGIPKLRHYSIVRMRYISPRHWAARWASCAIRSLACVRAATRMCFSPARDKPSAAWTRLFARCTGSELRSLTAPDRAMSASMMPSSRMIGFSSAGIPGIPSASARMSNRERLLASRGISPFPRSLQTVKRRL